MWSRHGTDLSRPFSDVADVAADLLDAVLDGELVAVLNDGSGVAFDRLQSRAGRRGPRRGADFTVHVALFDVLAVGDTDWRPRPYAERRTELLHLLEGGLATLSAVPATENRGQALRWVGALAGVEGLVGKRTDAPYAAGLASGWVKWLERHTTEAVVIGVTGTTPAAQALVLGRPTGGRMRAVGVSLPLAPDSTPVSLQLALPRTAMPNGRSAGNPARCNSWRIHATSLRVSSWSSGWLFVIGRLGGGLTWGCAG